MFAAQPCRNQVDQKIKRQPRSEACENADQHFARKNLAPSAGLGCGCHSGINKKKRDIVAKMGDMANELLLSLLNNKRPSET